MWIMGKKYDAKLILSELIDEYIILTTYERVMWLYLKRVIMRSK